MAFGTWGGMEPEEAKTLAHLIKRATAGESGEFRGAARAASYQAVGVAFFRQVWRLLGAKNREC